MLQRRRVTTAAMLLAAVVLSAISGCAITPRPVLSADLPQALHASGRLALHVEQEPPQAFFTTFQLAGIPAQGQLDLYNPLGSTLAQVRWNPAEAVVQQGNTARSYASLDQLITELTGANIPIPALFDWLQGHATEVPGWQPDLSRQPEGRISAVRLQPLPRARLQVILDAAAATPSATP